MIGVNTTVPVVQRNGLLAKSGLLVPLTVMGAAPDFSTVFLVIENGPAPISLEVSIADLRDALDCAESPIKSATARRRQGGPGE